jgi:hypothetical protein
MSWFRDLLRALTGGGTSGLRPPRSANGASSFHLTWEFSPARLEQAGFSEVSAVLEILEPPGVKALYFWALQVDLAGPGGVLGGAHTGLQWNPRYPHGKAVNWGGYASADRGGFVLSGTQSPLDGFADDPNTLNYSWHARRAYRIRVFPSPDNPGALRSEVTDLEAGETSVVRDLFPPEPLEAASLYLVRPVVWSEVFAACDDPSVTVRWSDLQAVDRTGSVVRPAAVRVNYQSWQAGGCPNTSAGFDERGLLQTTNTERRVAQGAALKVPAPPAAF